MPSKTSPWAIASIVLCTLLVTGAQVLMKTGLNTGKSAAGLVVDPFIIAGVALMVLAGILMTLALKHGELSVLHPLLSLGFVWVLGASIVLGEHVGMFQYLGVATIMGGVVLVGGSK